MQFGAYLKDQRDQRGWTQPVAAEHIGIEQSYLFKLETGRATPSEEMFTRLADAYGIDLDHMSNAVGGAELEKLREIAQVRAHLSLKLQSADTVRRRWLVAAVVMLVAGAALMSFTITQVRFPADQYVYMSKGVVLEGESSFVFADYWPGHVKRVALYNNSPCAAAQDGEDEDADRKEFFGMLVGTEPRSVEVDAVPEGVTTDTLARCSFAVEYRVPDPKLSRIDPEYRILDTYRGDQFTVAVEGGRRVFEETGRQAVQPVLNTHMAHALAVALIIGGFAGFFVSRRW